MSFEIKGMIAPVFTPVNEEGQPDFVNIPDYLTFLQNNGVKGILVGGTTGEAASFTAVERMNVFRAFRKVAKALGLKIILQVGGASLPDVITMAQCAEEMKADAIMTLPELYFKPQSTEQLVNYLKIVSKAAPSLPLIYYHFPMMSGVQVKNVPEFFKMASSIINFKGMKADLDVALQLQSQLRTDQRIFIGNHMLAPAAVVGFDSSIATVTNLFPGLVESLIEVSKAGKLEKIKPYQMKLNALVAAITSHGEFLPAMKAAMPMVTGINVGAPRRPLEPLTKQKMNELHDSLKKLNFGRMK
ncbi:N-acetylneuraminate lyase-like isoform X2 [Choristoneura fumiferana]